MELSHNKETKKEKALRILAIMAQKRYDDAFGVGIFQISIIDGTIMVTDMEAAKHDDK